MLPESVPTVEEIHGSVPPSMSFSDQAELNAWIDGHELPPTDSELDAIWAEEMSRRDQIAPQRAA